MAPQPVKPATRRLEMKPRLRGYRLEMCSCDRWKVMPARPRMTAPAGRPLKSWVLEQPSKMRPTMFSIVPDRGRNNMSTTLLSPLQPRILFLLCSQIKATIASR